MQLFDLKMILIIGIQGWMIYLRNYYKYTLTFIVLFLLALLDLLVKVFLPCLGGEVLQYSIL